MKQIDTDKLERELKRIDTALKRWGERVTRALEDIALWKKFWQIEELSKLTGELPEEYKNKDYDELTVMVAVARKARHKAEGDLKKMLDDPAYKGN